MPKVVFATPYLTKPIPAYVESLENSLPVVEAAGWEHSFVHVAESPYISFARATLLHKFMKSDADCILFIDYDLSWEKDAIVKVLQAEGDVVCATYRLKCEEEDYMGHVCIKDGYLTTKHDGCVKATAIPAGFMKITRKAIEQMASFYPELRYGKGKDAVFDLFLHGVCFGDNVWYGEDYAFSKRWTDLGGELWIVPDVSISHYLRDFELKGNFHHYLLSKTGVA